MNCLLYSRQCTGGSCSHGSPGIFTGLRYCVCVCVRVYVSTPPDSKITGLLCFTVVSRCPLRKLSLSTVNVNILEICDCPVFSAVLCSFVSLCGKISLEFQFAPTNLQPTKMREWGAREVLDRSISSMRSGMFVQRWYTGCGGQIND